MSAEISIQKLRKLIDPDELAIIYPALRQDQLTWDRIQDPQFLETMEGSYQGQRKFWKPCNLALLETDASTPGHNPDPNPQYGKVDLSNIELADGLIMQIGTVDSLQRAGVIAYKLVNEVSRSEELSSTISQMVSIFNSGNQQEQQAIKTIFCCFFGLQKQPI
jgi:hypothetical protein